MKKLILLFVLVFSLAACHEPGEVHNVTPINNPMNVEIFKYYIDKEDYVYIARFKSSPNVVATTWEEQEGKYTETRGNVVVYENDSIVIYKK